ncbi:MAG: hypothetical protein B6U87_00950 [Candidatus Aenigmarchaeota archaeon ex4484_52]|nr:MAG: hypothetical protein B6U87_00950 [Candidatus Aenigmarchaeota archaeon ex4484_52]
MNSKIHPDIIKKYAIVLFFVGIAFIVFYNDISGYETKQIQELSDDDLGKKISVCGILQNINKKENVLFFKLIDANSSASFIDCVIFKKNMDLIDLEISKHNISLSGLSKNDYLCVNGNMEKYNNKFKIIVKTINKIILF